MINKYRVRASIADSAASIQSAPNGIGARSVLQIPNAPTSSHKLPGNPQFRR